jgi:O-antigen/teichoic acid export membrane protein
LTLLLAVVCLSYQGWFGMRPDKRLVRPLFVYALKSHTEGIALLANLRADQAIISMFLASAALGLYAVAVTLTSAVVLLASALATVAFPTIAADSSASSRSSKLALYVRVALALSLLAALVPVAITPALISTFFGGAFLQASSAARVLLLATVILGANRVLSAGIKANNLPLVPGIAEGIAVVMTVISLVVLLPRLGIMGAAIASLLAYSTSFAYLLWYSVKRFNIPATGFLVPTKSDLGWIYRQLRDRRTMAARH